MCPKLIILLFFQTIFAYSEDPSFTYNGFKSVNLTLDGRAKFTSNGLLELTNTRHETAHAFHPKQVKLKNSSNSNVYAHLFAYFWKSTVSVRLPLFPKRSLPGASSALYLGLFDATNDGNSSNHVFAVELDTMQNPELDDIDSNHVGVGTNGIRSYSSASAAYYAN
ncbi:Legume lectin domain [Dillenia turbinata]|uniref:Legume lectin domain n=1 Tax=Dillenia turbinata TaxID=194707 RepID=A0AAN8W085_9MAGN